jgi:predicted Zn finger-like uncharacterized protein
MVADDGIVAASSRGIIRTMSLATRCTACGTAFRVVQDQLKVSGGWVRCGSCGEVFNARDGLFEVHAGTPSEPGSPVAEGDELETRITAEDGSGLSSSLRRRWTSTETALGDQAEATGDAMPPRHVNRKRADRMSSPSTRRTRVAESAASAIR